MEGDGLKVDSRRMAGSGCMVVEPVEVGFRKVLRGKINKLDEPSEMMMMLHNRGQILFQISQRADVIY